MHDQNGIVKDRREIAKGIVALTLQLEQWDDIVPGQFAHVAIEGSFLRRPISIAGANAAEKAIVLIVQKEGTGSTRLANSSRGSSVKLLSPLGRGFSWKDERLIWLVGGGVGVAPLLLLARRLREEGRTVESFVGFRDPVHVYGLHELGEHGSVHSVVGGLVTDTLVRCLEEGHPDLLMACGPVPMLRILQKICRERGIRAKVSLEEHMGCGIGACLTCNCKVKIEDGSVYRRVCVDGPVFDLNEVIFDVPE